MTNHEQAVERLWSFQGHGRTIWCVLREQGSHGIEAQVFVDGALRVGRRFDTRDLAVRWAASQRESTDQICQGAVLAPDAPAAPTMSLDDPFGQTVMIRAGIRRPPEDASAH